MTRDSMRSDTIGSCAPTSCLSATTTSPSWGSWRRRRQRRRAPQWRRWARRRRHLRAPARRRRRSPKSRRAKSSRWTMVATRHCRPSPRVPRGMRRLQSWQRLPRHKLRAGATAQHRPSHHVPTSRRASPHAPEGMSLFLFSLYHFTEFSNNLMLLFMIYLGEIQLLPRLNRRSARRRPFSRRHTRFRSFLSRRWSQ